MSNSCGGRRAGAAWWWTPRSEMPAAGPAGPGLRRCSAVRSALPPAGPRRAGVQVAARGRPDRGSRRRRAGRGDLPLGGDHGRAAAAAHRRGRPRLRAVVDTVVADRSARAAGRGRASPAYVHRPAELQAEAAEAGLWRGGCCPIEGPAAYLVDVDERWAVPGRPGPGTRRGPPAGGGPRAGGDGTPPDAGGRAAD